MKSRNGRPGHYYLDPKNQRPQTLGNTGMGISRQASGAVIEQATDYISNADNPFNPFVHLKEMAFQLSLQP